MYTYLGKNKLLSFKVNTEVNTALMLINIYILNKHNVFQNYKKTNKQKPPIQCQKLRPSRSHTPSKPSYLKAKRLWALPVSSHFCTKPNCTGSDGEDRGRESWKLPSSLFQIEKKKSPMVCTNCWTCDDFNSKFILKGYNLNFSKICI